MDVNGVSRSLAPILLIHGVDIGGNFQNLWELYGVSQEKLANSF